MCHGHREGDVAHALPADLLLSDLHTASVAYYTSVADSLVFTAMALVVLCRAEYPLAEKAVTLRLIGTVVDSLGLQHFTG